MKRIIVLPIVLCIIILLTASTVLAAYGPQKAPSGSSGSSGSSSSSSGSSGGSSSSGGGSCAIGYKLVEGKCVKTEVLAEEKPSEQPAEAAGEQPAAPLEQPIGEEALTGQGLASNLAWLWATVVALALAAGIAVYVYRRRED